MALTSSSDLADRPAESPGSTSNGNTPGPHRPVVHWGTLARRCASPLVFILVFLALALWVGQKFTDPGLRLLDVHQNAPVLIMSLAAMTTLITAKFDLSIGGMAALTTFLAVGLRTNQGLPMWLVLAVCVAIGLLGGFVNGLLVVKARVNTFIATLGTGGVFTGISAVYSHGTQLTPSPTGPQLPTWFAGADSLGDFGTRFPSVLVWILLALLAAFAALVITRHTPGRWPVAQRALVGVGPVVAICAALLASGYASRWVRHTTWLIVLVLLIATILWVVINRTTFGRHLYAIGANETAARLAGVPVERETIKAFVVGGLLASIAGILLAATQGSAAQGVGAGQLLPAFAAAFLSTVMFSLGSFTVWGSIIGAICLIWVSQGLILGNVDYTWSDVVNGAVLLVAVSFATITSRRGLRS